MKLRRMLAAVLTAVTAAVAAAPAAAAVPPPVPGTLQRHDVTDVYASGLSSGGFMANQLHVAHSAVFDGAGIFSAGAYRCAQSNVGYALYACMDTLLTRKTPAELAAETRALAAADRIDPVSGLSGDRVYLYHGTADTTVKAPVNDDLAAYYRTMGSGVVYDRTSAAGHAWVSPLGPNACSSTASPYINRCGDADPAGDMLGHLFGATPVPAAASLTGKLVQFDQGLYVPGGNPAAVSMGAEGFVYLPRDCTAGPCRLMVALHGCRQYHGLVGNALMDKAYLNEYADTNRMIVLYPQATTAPDNPRGCWNWWAYGGDAAYAEKAGKQVTALMNMVRALGGTGGADPTATPTATPTVTPACVTASNYAHVSAGRAHVRSRPRQRIRPGPRPVEPVRQQLDQGDRTGSLGEVLTPRIPAGRHVPARR
ncbi:extracellular catalytic domain type 2 short-chain-length polyhydroxyalkanoate depolymerase [Planomonospora algeriensis]